MRATPQVGTEEFRSVVGVEHVRAATPDDAIDGVQPVLVVAPGSVEELSGVLRLASEQGLAVGPRGASTHLHIGAPPERLDVIVSTRGLERILEYNPGDLVVKAGAGVPLGALQEALAESGQMLALDPPDGRATLGGIIATDASGPLRLRYGTVRDLLIGVTVVLADGTIARAGGKVVKNVAGYDLAKLFTGALGTLGVIAEATFRLHPLPDATHTVVVQVDTPGDAGRLVADLAASPLVPSAAELRWDQLAGPGQVVVVFEGIAPGVDAQAAALLEMARPHGTAYIPDAGAEQALWDQLRHPAGFREGEACLKLSYPPAELEVVISAVLAEAQRRGSNVRCSAHAATGVAYVGIREQDSAALPDLVDTWRAMLTVHNGSIVVLRAPADVKPTLDVWGATGDALPLMRRLKQQFDPNRILNPGRYIGGI